MECRSTEYSAEPNYSRIETLLQKICEIKDAPKQSRRSPVTERKRDALSDSVLSKGKRLFGEKSQIDIIDLARSDGEDIRPTKAVKVIKSVTSKEKVAVAARLQPNQTPLLLDEPPPPRKCKTDEVLKSIIHETDKPVACMIRVLSGPHAGVSQLLPQVSTKKTARSGRDSGDNGSASSVCIGRTCDECDAGAVLLLPEDVYVSDRYAFMILVFCAV